MLIECIIVEDEPLAMQKIQDFVARFPYLHLAGSFHNGEDAMLYCKENKVALIFSDIEMGETSGIHLIESLTYIPYIIVTTAYDQYAVKGYELNITDYLLKPIRFDRFLKAVEKVRSAVMKKGIQQKDFFFVQSAYRNVKIFFKDVLYIEGMRDYRCIHLENAKVLTLLTFTELESLVPKDKLFRVHKSYMVSINKIEFIERNRIKIGERLIPLSDTYKAAFYALMGLKDTTSKP